MKRVLSNLKPISVSNHFRNRDVTFRYKSKRVFNMDLEEERAEYYFWKDRYGFIIDITAKTKGNEGGEKT